MFAPRSFFSSRATSVLQLFVHIRAASDALEAYARREDVLRYIGQLTSVKVGNRVKLGDRQSPVVTDGEMSDRRRKEKTERRPASRR